MNIRTISCGGFNMFPVEQIEKAANIVAEINYGISEALHESLV